MLIDQPPALPPVEEAVIVVGDGTADDSPFADEQTVEITREEPRLVSPPGPTCLGPSEIEAMIA